MIRFNNVVGFNDVDGFNNVVRFTTHGWIFSRESDSTIANVRPFVRSSVCPS